jgi:hypothetical protein
MYNNITITLFVSPETELEFFANLIRIDELPFESPFTWETDTIKISRTFKDNWIAVNIPIRTYTKFIYSFSFNKGKFL